MSIAKYCLDLEEGLEKIWNFSGNSSYLTCLKSIINLNNSISNYNRTIKGKPRIGANKCYTV